MVTNDFKLCGWGHFVQPHSMNHPGATRHPSTGGELAVLSPYSPPVEGCRPQTAGWFFVQPHRSNDFIFRTTCVGTTDPGRPLFGLGLQSYIYGLLNDRFSVVGCGIPDAPSRKAIWQNGASRMPRPTSGPAFSG